MTEAQKQLILDAWDYCDEEDKSTEFMIQYMSDTSGVSYDGIVDYIVSSQAEKDRFLYFVKRKDFESAKHFKHD